MGKIKIISNPYQKRIAYQSWDDCDMDWKDVDESSDLLKEKYVTGFFPFQVKEIVDIIIRDYEIPNEKINIVFQGTEDEFKELQELCNVGGYADVIALEKSDIFLENARDIFPDINEVFDESLRPLIMQTGNVYDKIKRELEKYTDVSNDVIPVCVLGNYSSGKSTFINSLIGSEILPSGAEPLTAKIYKMKQSLYEDRASIILKYDEKSMKLKFDDNGFRFSMATNENALSKKLAEELGALKDTAIALLVNKALEIINGFDTGIGEGKISDTIEIEVPFVSGLWGEYKGQFVIFDTPGSNSASNKSHSELLREALGGFSNGLPLYLSEFDKLDSTDNESLYREIEKLEELDDRFTMVIVNKADAAGLEIGGFTKEKEACILGETIPKHLYKSGIYFVSSVVGLGSKNGGEFFDDHYAELFDEKKSKFSDKNSRFYKTLYQYNIMPEQMKKRAVSLAEDNDNLLWANSGLLTIEREIQIFAVKYSSYNKCQQAKLFLDKIIRTTTNEIEQTKREREELKKRLHEKLKIDEKELIDKIEAASISSQSDYEHSYQEYMLSLDGKANKEFTEELLKKQEAEIEKSKQVDNNLEDRKSDADHSVYQMLGNFSSGVKNVFSKHSMDELVKFGKGVVEDLGRVVDKYEELNDIRKRVDKATADDLLGDVTKEFNKRFDTAQALLDESSRHFWGEKTGMFKELLIGIVSGTSVLDADKREELEKIIIAYGDIVFEHHAEEILLKHNFKKGFRIGGFEIIKSDKLNIDKLVKVYNNELLTNIAAIRKTIETSHTDSFVKWKENLADVVTSKIVEYSPLLHSQAQIIREETEKIMELEDKQKQLAFYSETISKMMDWKGEMLHGD